MAPISITVDTRSVERLVYWILIIGLGVFLALNMMSSSKLKKELDQLKGGTSASTTGTNSVTGAVTAQNQPATPTQAAPAPECKLNSDCAGKGANFECKEEKCVEKQPECRLNSDCLSKGANYKCVDEACVFEPECEETSDCKAGYECIKQACEEMELSGEIEMKLENIQYLYDKDEDNTRLKSFDITITNGRDSTIDYSAKVWFVSKVQYSYIGDFNWAYRFVWGTDQNMIDLPAIKSGETWTKRIQLVHADGQPGGNWPLGGIGDDDKAYVDVKLYRDADIEDEDAEPEAEVRNEFVVSS